MYKLFHTFRHVNNDVMIIRILPEHGRDMELEKQLGKKSK